MHNGKQPIRAGVDIGGTFTDVALECGDRLYSAKVLTDYEKPERAIIEGLRRAAAQASIEPAARAALASPGAR